MEEEDEEEEGEEEEEGQTACLKAWRGQRIKVCVRPFREREPGRWKPHGADMVLSDITNFNAAAPHIQHPCGDVFPLLPY